MKLSSLLLATGGAVVSAAPYNTLEGAGTTNPSKYLWAISEMFETQIRGPASLGYRAVGSSTGQKEFVGEDGVFSPLNDYGAGDIPMTTDRYDQVVAAGRTVAHFPFVMGAIAVFYNGDDGKIPDDISIDPCTLAKIFSGQITNWNDAAIADLNEGLALPDLEITVVHRTLGSSSTAGITQFIEKATEADDCSDSWGQGSGSTIDWFEGSVAAEGSGGVTAEIKATPGAIGYLDAGHGYGENLNEVALRNAAGFYLEATDSEIAAAGAVAVKDEIIPSNSTDSFADVNLYNLGGDTTWPITMISYIYVDVSPNGLGDKASTYTENLPLLVALLEYINSDDGQALAAASEFGFTGIPTELRDLNQQTIDLIKSSNPNAPEWMVFESSTAPLTGAAPNVISSKRKSWATLVQESNSASIGDLGEDAPSLIEDITALQEALAALQEEVDDLETTSSNGSEAPPQMGSFALYATTACAAYAAWNGFAQAQ